MVFPPTDFPGCLPIRVSLSVFVAPNTECSHHRGALEQSHLSHNLGRMAILNSTVAFGCKSALILYGHRAFT